MQRSELQLLGRHLDLMAGWWRWERWGEGQSGICFLSSCLPKARIYDSQAWCKESCDYFLFQNLETRASLALGSQFTALDYITVRTYCGEGWRGGNEIAEEGSTFLLSSLHTWEDSTQLWGKKGNDFAVKVGKTVGYRRGCDTWADLLRVDSKTQQ